jgi:hypothetical protein
MVGIRAVATSSPQYGSAESIQTYAQLVFFVLLRPVHVAKWREKTAVMPSGEG